LSSRLDARLAMKARIVGTMIDASRTSTPSATAHSQAAAVIPLAFAS
jgi:hypothetical protein